MASQLRRDLTRAGPLTQTEIELPAIQLPAATGPTGPPPTEYLDVGETARRLGVSSSFLNKARIAGDGPPFHKFAKAVRYSWPSVLAWAASRQRRSTSDSGNGAAA
jgi:hypothetical protein